MSGLAFFDSNVLLYADDKGAPAKQRIAIEIFSRHRADDSAVLSLQVMQEYFAAATKKLGVDPGVAHRKVEILSRCKVVRFSAEDVLAAIELHRLGGISFLDSMIVHAARISGARLLYSEDMRDGGTIGGVRVVNPFAAPKRK